VSNFTALFDACVLYPAPLRDFLMRLAITDLFRAKWTVDILAAVKRTVIPKPQDLGFCFCPEGFFAPALTDLLCSGLMVALQTDTASPAAKIFLLALISRSW
jgi:hypothetical protein